MTEKNNDQKGDDELIQELMIQQHHEGASVGAISAHIKRHACCLAHGCLWPCN